jgi:lycopene beta-cyclase
MQTDLLIAGAGLAGLTLALELSRRPAFAQRQIVLLDRDTKTRNDRTWCFWATDAELATLPPVVHRSWPEVEFHHPDFSRRLDVGDYHYRMVRGADFYAWAKDQLAQHPNVQWVHGEIASLDAGQGLVHLTDGATWQAQQIFNSALTPLALLPDPVTGLYPQAPLSVQWAPQAPGRTIRMLQHFKGWVIETPTPAFDPNVATLMDFRIEQHGHTRFVYVLPLSDRQALVEFTVFSPTLLDPAAYEEALRDYLAKYLKINDFKVLEEEFGVIPMTDFAFKPAVEGRVTHIGTAGGFVKGSSGYAFKRTWHKLRAFVDDWERTGLPHAALLQSRRRFRVYDSVFLRALNDQLAGSQAVFGGFFKSLKGHQVFRFLDEESSFGLDLRALHSVPIVPFLRAVLRQRGRLLRV